MQTYMLVSRVTHGVMLVLLVLCSLLVAFASPWFDVNPPYIFIYP